MYSIINNISENVELNKIDLVILKFLKRRIFMIQFFNSSHYLIVIFMLRTNIYSKIFIYSRNYFILKLISFIIILIL